MLRLRICHFCQTAVSHASMLPFTNVSELHSFDALSACGDMWYTQLVTNLKCHICVFAVFYRQNYITQPVGRMGQMDDLSCDRIT